MKKIFSLFNQRAGYLSLGMIVAFLLLLSSCKKEEQYSGQPEITKVSLLDSSKVDSAFTKAFPGTLILITGKNLGGVTNIYFNNFEVYFNPTYNTNTHIIVSIPPNAPTEATNPNVPNTLRIVTTHGELTYQFKLDIPPPVIDYIVNENTLPGDSMVIMGANLWLIQKIVLPGNTEITTVSSTPDGSRLSFLMPDLNGASGRMIIQAKYGNAISMGPVNKYAGDSVISNLTAAWESGEPSVFNWAWWGANRTNDASLFPGARAYYLQNVFGGVGAKDGGWWNGNRSGNFNEVALFSDNIRSEQAANYALKFEINTKEPWKAGINVLRLGNDYAYRFMPYATAPNSTFHTGNKWQTITIPLSEFRKKDKRDGEDVEGIGASAVVMGDMVGAGGKVAFTYRFITEEEPVDLYNAAYDNFRIVKIK